MFGRKDGDAVTAAELKVYERLFTDAANRLEAAIHETVKQSVKKAMDGRQVRQVAAECSGTQASVQPAGTSILTIDEMRKIVAEADAAAAHVAARDNAARRRDALNLAIKTGAGLGVVSMARAIDSYLRGDA